jgi:signal transduction histidine kinase/ActR/RegA family two-component response regulator
MAAWHRFTDWRLRAKIAALLVVASMLPLAISSWISIDHSRAEQFRSTAAELGARSEMLAARIDTFNAGYQRGVARMARVSSALTLLQARPAQVPALRATLDGQLQVWPGSDSNIRGVAVLDTQGVVVAGTEPPLLGHDLSYRSFVKAALAGNEVVSDIHVAEAEVGGAPVLAFLAPVRSAAGEIIGAAAFWVKAEVITEFMRESNGVAGPGSFGVLFDRFGIRIAHSYLQDLVFRPGRPLPAATIEALVAEQRFGARTRELLQDVRKVSWGDQLSAGALPEAGMFRGHAAGNEQWNYAVGRRCTTAAWTVYYLLPEAALQAQATSMLRQRLLIAGIIMLLALGAGALFAAAILKPVRALTAGARAIGSGNLDARVAIDRRDELGELGNTFNAMAARIQEQADALRRESEDQYRRLFQTMNESFFAVEMVFDETGQAIDWVYRETNREFELQSGLQDVVGKRRSEVVPDAGRKWIPKFGEVARTGEPMQVEEESQRLGRFFDVRAFRVGGPDSRRVAVLFDDITERHLAQRRQQEQLERLNLLHQITRGIGERQDLQSIFSVVLRELEARMPIDFGCLLLNEDGGMLRVSCTGQHSAMLASQLSLQEGAGIDVPDSGLARCLLGHLLHEPELGSADASLPRRLAQAGLGAMVAAPLLVESKVFGVLLAARRSEGFSSGECEFLRQLSEHVALAAHQAQLYTALQAAYQDLRHTQQSALQQERLRALGQMASGIAHDINNAISPIALYTDSLLERETQLGETARNQLVTIQRAIHDVAATVARMREFYRVREPQVQLAPVHLNALVQQVVELTRPRWSALPQQRGITIEMLQELQPGLPPIQGAGNEIREALTNLVFNAVDAMPQGGLLTMRTRVLPEGRVAVEVQDTGIGMDEDSRRRCLEPFFTTKGERGTGLGLAMVYGMAQRHGAQIDIRSVPGLGTCVQLSFNATHSVEATPEPQPVAAPRGLRILLVDDDPVLLRSLRDILEQDGHEVAAAGGGQQGIHMARAAIDQGRPFAVTITDLGMPHVDGRQVARTVKALAPRTPVIMLTGWGQRLISEGDVPPEVDMVLSKPPRVRELREALARCCAGQAVGA